MKPIVQIAVLLCIVPWMLFSAPVASPGKSRAEKKTDTLEKTPPVLTFKQLHKQWEELAGDSARRGQCPPVHPSKKGQLPLSATSPVDKTSTADSSKKKILLLTGDSMISCLSWGFQKYAPSLGYEMEVVPFICSTTEYWAKNRFLSRLIKKYHPFFIIMCLGSNEFFLSPGVINKRAEFITSILGENDSIPLVWIGPPNLDETKALDTVIRAKIGNGRYFCTSDLVLDRQQDNRHPSVNASAAWSDSVGRWIQYTSDYRIAMVPPGSLPASYYIRNNYAATAQARIKAMADSAARAKADSLAALNASLDSAQIPPSTPPGGFLPGSAWQDIK
jgi:hypothetical protein